MTSKRLAGLCTAVLLVSTAASASAAPRTFEASGPTETGVRLLGATALPHGLRYDGTTVGGLSGIDYDPRSGNWVLISDDRSRKQPARFYTADIDMGAGDIGIELTDTVPLRRPDGTVYPPSGTGGSVDPEAIRFDPRSQDLWWSSEGERAEHRRDPAILRTERDGSFAGRLPLASNLRMREHTGPRRNETLEGLTFAAGGSLVVGSMEGPLIQDGAAPTAEHGALGRITVQNRSGQVLSQYAYPMDPVFASPPKGGSANNGVSEILAVNRGNPFRYLVLERSYVSGVGNSIRIHRIDTRGADDVRAVDSLRGTEVQPVRKELLVDLSEFEGLSTIDNIEGMTWGPRLPSGERTLVLVSDDNFSASQTTQIIALAVR
ncbi:esterase-like activity of phytase family protein [Haloactinomyces albus]|uniref:3-phytase n=1 Tax=Haloactinomyces albus TaxID=1352928 RepID=A0AAE4CNH4_9ACTN|nr:esterase-like activity of phytase family protein [Haloactinomyces albus]MDR7302037.1 3-phytase [Haloactinomyces albus]